MHIPCLRCTTFELEYTRPSLKLREPPRTRTHNPIAGPHLPTALRVPAGTDHGGGETVAVVGALVVVRELHTQISHSSHVGVRTYDDIPRVQQYPMRSRGAVHSGKRKRDVRRNRYVVPMPTTRHKLGPHRRAPSRAAPPCAAHSRSPAVCPAPTPTSPETRCRTAP